MSTSIARPAFRSILLAFVAVIATVMARPVAAQRLSGLGRPGQVGHPTVGNPTGWPDRRIDRLPSLDRLVRREPDVISSTMTTSAEVAFGPFITALISGRGGRHAGTVYYGGTVIGATLGAYVSSHPRAGCVRRGRVSRLARSAAAALVGTAPALLYVGTGHAGYSQTGMMLGLSTPLSQGVAADLLLREPCGTPA